MKGDNIIKDSLGYKTIGQLVGHCPDIFLSRCIGLDNIGGGIYVSIYPLNCPTLKAWLNAGQLSNSRWKND